VDKTVREVLEKEVVAAYQLEYQDLLATFQGLDTKAQGTITTNGIFLAGIFAFLNAASFAVDSIAKVLVLCAVALLIAAILLAIFGMHVREMAGPPSGSQADKMASHLLALENDAEIEARLPGYYSERAQAWSNCLAPLRRSVESKAELIWYAQLSLLLGMIFVAVIIFYRLR